MSLANTFYPHVLNFAAPLSTKLVFLEDVSLDRAYTITKRGGPSEIAPCFIGAGSVSPTITFTTQQIKEILLLTTDEGICREIAAGLAKLWYRAGKNFGFRETIASSTHIECVLTEKSLLCWNSLTATPEMASLSCMLAASFHITLEALQINKNVASPPAADCATPFSLGKVLINSVVVEGVTSVTWSNNIENRFRTYSGETAPGFLGLDRAEPTVTITTDDVDQIADSSEGADDMVLVEIYLRERTRTAFYTPIATTNHIKISAASGLKVIPSVSGAPGSIDIVCHIQRTTGNLVLIDTATAIPA